jgi:hypothetical protein
MSNKQHHRLILEHDVFALTAKGQNELRGAETSLAPPALEVLVLIDGKSSVGETAARARTIGKEAVANILGKLLHDKLIEIAGEQTGSLDFVDFFQTTGSIKPSAAATAKAKKGICRHYFVIAAARLLCSHSAQGGQREKTKEDEDALGEGDRS